ncbi:hypothetical protein MMC22_008117 [Lobaria immixta]|nr:hypothetical protein [Lobaria immixta]
MSYAFENPANAFCKEDDKLARSDLKLTCMNELMPPPVLKEACQNSQVHFQFEPPMNPPTKGNSHGEPMTIAVLRQRSKKMTDDGWHFNAESLSDAPPKHPTPFEYELTKEEYSWLQGLKLAQVIEEKRARQKETELWKQELPWETNEVNTWDCDLSNNESLDEELNAFYGSAGENHIMTDQVPINDEGNLENNLTISTTRVTLPSTHSIQPGSYSDVPKNPIVSFADSGISVNDQFPADLRKMSTAGLDTGDLFADELDEFLLTDIAMEDIMGAELSSTPSAMPTFPVQEASKADRDSLRSLYCNTSGMGVEFLNAPYDLEGFATDFDHSDDNSSLYDPERLFTYDADRAYNEKTQYVMEFPDKFFNPPAEKTVFRPVQVNNNPAGTATAATSVQGNTSGVPKQCLATPNQDITCSPDRSAAAGNQLLTTLQAHVNSTTGTTVPASALPIRTASKSSSNKLAPLTPSRLTPYFSQGPNMGSSSRRTNLIPEYDSSDSENEDSDIGVKALTPSTPKNLRKRGASSLDCPLHGNSAADFKEITSKDSNFNLHKLPTTSVVPSFAPVAPSFPPVPVVPSFPPVYPSTPVVPSTPATQAHYGGRSVVPATPYVGTPVEGSVLDLGDSFYGFQGVTTPTAGGTSTPTTPSTPSFSSLGPYEGSYAFTISPTPTGPRITTVLRGQVLSAPPPKTRTPPDDAAKARRANARRAAAAREAAAREAFTKEAAKHSNKGEPPAKKRLRRSKSKTAEAAA